MSKSQFLLLDENISRNVCPQLHSGVYDLRLIVIKKISFIVGFCHSLFVAFEFSIFINLKGFIVYSHILFYKKFLEFNYVILNHEGTILFIYHNIDLEKNEERYWKIKYT